MIAFENEGKADDFCARVNKDIRDKHKGIHGDVYHVEPMEVVE